jgi:hypothetical protein
MKKIHLDIFSSIESFSSEFGSNQEWLLLSTLNRTNAMGVQLGVDGERSKETKNKGNIYLFGNVHSGCRPGRISIIQYCPIYITACRVNVEPCDRRAVWPASHVPGSPCDCCYLWHYRFLEISFRSTNRGATNSKSSSEVVTTDLDDVKLIPQ